MKIRNQQQQVLYYLLNWDRFSLVDVINDSMFFKFQTRLSELEERFGTLAKREKRTIRNRFGREVTIYLYTAHRKSYIKQLMVTLDGKKRTVT